MTIVSGCGGSNENTQVVLTAKSTTITQGSSTVLEWSSVNATSVKSSNFNANSVNGYIAVSPEVSTIYFIIVSGPTGDFTSKVTIYVLPAKPVSNVPSGWFTTVTSAYPNIGDSFSLQQQIPDSLYPIPCKYSDVSTKSTLISGLESVIVESEEAMKCWNTADPRIAILSRVDNNAVITVRFIDTITYGTATNILGLTTVSGTEGSPVYDIQVAMIDPVEGSPLMKAWEIRRVLIHEIGHVFGLGHSDNKNDVMYFRSQENQGSTYTTYLTLGDALTLWVKLNTKQINWVPTRPVITISAPVGMNRDYYKATNGKVIDIYTR